jgi:hypothetical protein
MSLRWNQTLNYFRFVMEAAHPGYEKEKNES